MTNVSGVGANYPESNISPIRLAQADPVVETLMDGKADLGKRLEAIQTMAASGKPEAAEALAKFLGHIEGQPDDVLSLMRAAMFALGKLGYPSAVSALSQKLQDAPSPGLRGVAAINLGAIGGPEAATALGRTLLTPTNDMLVRETAAK